jgi:hypothetical protein
MCGDWRIAAGFANRLAPKPFPPDGPGGRGSGVDDRIRIAVAALALVAGVPSVAGASLPAALADDSVDPALPHSPGLYLLGAIGREETMTKITPSDVRPDGDRVTVPLLSARAQTKDRRPIFYAYFDQSLPKDLKAVAKSAWSGLPGASATSPEDVLLVRKEEGANWRVGRAAADASVPFDSREVRPGVFRLQPVVDLAAGEYGFVQKLPARDGGLVARVFDFGVE